MSRIRSIQHEIERLSRTEFAELRAWFADRAWEQWDERIERDAAAGKLDHLREEAMEAKRKNELRDL